MMANPKMPLLVLGFVLGRAGPRESRPADKPDLAKMDELNRAAAAMKHVFDPYLEKLDPQLDEDVSEPSVE